MPLEKNHKINVGRVCSQETRDKISAANVGKKRTQKTKDRMKDMAIKRKPFTQEHKDNLVSAALKRKPRTEKTRKKMRESQLGRKHSQKTKDKISTNKMGSIPWNKGITVEKIKGSKNHNWKGGITSENQKLRDAIEYKLWRRSVFARDNFTCQKTGISGGKLNAHHIHNFSDFPELRLAIDNGITLSEKAHRDFHKIYGIKNNTKEQIYEFMKKNIVTKKGK